MDFGCTPPARRTSSSRRSRSTRARPRAGTAIPDRCWSSCGPGCLTHEARGRTIRRFGAGEAFIELPGTGNEHCGCNLGDEPVKLEVLFIAPCGEHRAEVLTCSA